MLGRCIDDRGPDESLSVADLGMLATGQSASSFRSISLSQSEGDDQQLRVGEEFTITNVHDPLLGPTTTTTVDLTLVGSGTLSTLATTSDILVGVDSEGHQYVVFPDGDMPVLLGTVASTISLDAIGYDFSTGSPICFTRGTMIRTPNGKRAIETLAVCDLVMTRDHGPKPALWIGRKRFGANLIANDPALAPVRIKAAALGNNTPFTDLVVSPQHRILIRSEIARRMFGAGEVLVAAKNLAQLDGVDICTDAAEFEYFHILFDRHEIIFANGAETESLYTGPQALASVDPAMRREIKTLFPEIATLDYAPVPARALAPGRRARKLAERHGRNRKALVAEMA